MRCLDAEAIRAWHGGSMTGDERERVDEHLDGCSGCRERVSVLPVAAAPGRHASGPAGATPRAAGAAWPGSVAQPAAPGPDARGSAESVAEESAARGRVEKTQPIEPAGMPAAAGGGALAVPPGTRVGHFVIRRTLGAGSGGVVYGAEDPELGRQVALKLLHGGSGAPAGRRGAAARRIIREARLAARVSHPNVVSIYEVGPFGDQVFIAMELVEGDSLSRWLEARPRSLKEILDVMVAAGRGLAAAHAAGLVHRDFKPDNVLVGEDGRVRVTDFGLARRGREVDPRRGGAARARGGGAEARGGDGTAEPGGAQARRNGADGAAARNAVEAHGGGAGGRGIAAGGTGVAEAREIGRDAAAGAAAVAAGGRLAARRRRPKTHGARARVVGTPAYMPPEQHAGGHTDPRSDQFSFCVALYEALYRQRPFAGDNVRELAAEVQRGRVQPPPAGSRVPASLHRIVLRGLSVRPGDRFSSMGALLDALGRDRTRLLRRWVYGALVALAAVATGLGADWIARERTLAVTRSSFAAAQEQLGRSLGLRYEAFTALSDLSYVVPVIREVTGNLDQSDFGLGEAGEDRLRLAELHENLRSADWLTWARASQRGVIAVADYKGRLLFTSAAPELWGNDVRALGAAAGAYDLPDGAAGAQAMVIRGEDSRMVAAGLLGGVPRPGLHVVFARATALGGAPRAVFLQIIEGKRLLSDVSLGEGAELALVAPGGAAEGDIAPAVLAAGRAARGTTEEVRDGGRSWLVSSYPVRALGSGAGEKEIATIVVARPIDAGLAGLFPAARLVLGVLALLLAAGTLVAAWWARAARRRLTATRP